jgi:cytochrome c biogenesis protein CcmG, thiol:disulfide interchange protein DsbE
VIAFAMRDGDTETATGGGDAVALSGETLAGESFDLSQTRGKPTVVNFFASWCPPCNSEAPDLVAFAKAHPEVAVVGVALNDARADTEAFVARYGIEFPVVFDAEGGLGGAWGVEGIPTTVFLDAQGEERERIVGGASQEQFEEKLEAAL